MLLILLDHHHPDLLYHLCGSFLNLLGMNAAHYDDMLLSEEVEEKYAR